MAIQIITPNPNVTCTPGLCLAYVQDAARIAAKYPTAITAWNASRSKHQDQSFPSGVWVPLWFQITDNPYGHVVWRAPDGSIYSASSPTSHVAVHHASLAALEAYYSGRLIYLGWTEDVEDTLVINLNGEQDMTNDDTLPRLWVSFMDLPLTDPGYQGFHDYWLGKTEAACIQWLMDTPRHLDIITKSREYTDPAATQKTLDAIKQLVAQL